MINAQLNDELDAAIAVGAFSFLIATAAKALALGWILAGGAARPRLAPLRGVPWWGWLGGLCGATYVTAVFSLIPEIGASAVVVLTVAGQQLAPSPWIGTGSWLRVRARRPESWPAGLLYLPDRGRAQSNPHPASVGVADRRTGDVRLGRRGGLSARLQQRPASRDTTAPFRTSRPAGPLGAASGDSGGPRASGKPKALVSSPSAGPGACVSHIHVVKLVDRIVNRLDLSVRLSE